MWDIAKFENMHRGKKYMIEALEELKKVPGYLGAGIFTIQGELLEGITDISGIHFESAGSQVHDILLSAQQMCKEAGFQHANMIQIDTDLGVVFTKCYNNGTKHFLTVLIIKSDGNIAMAKSSFIKTIKNELVVALEHVNLSGANDFSKENLENKYGFTKEQLFDTDLYYPKKDM